jgi:hypothetical protein
MILFQNISTHSIKGVYAYMTETEIYLELSDRYITAALNNVTSIHEAAGFESYHAFESLAGAYNSNFGYVVSRKHATKLHSFCSNYNKKIITRIHPLTIAQLTIELVNLRNTFLYPIKNGTHYISPKETMTATQIKRKISIISSIISHFKKALM